jgi:hypothetical protein
MVCCNLISQKPVYKIFIPTSGTKLFINNNSIIFLFHMNANNLTPKTNSRTQVEADKANARAKDFGNHYSKHPTGYSTRPSYMMKNDPDLKHDHIFEQFRSGAQDLRKGLYGDFGMPEPIRRGKAFGSGSESGQKKK